MIPHTIHRIWLGGLEPDWQRPFAAGWRQPGWRVEQWDDRLVEGLFPLINQDVYDRAEEIAPDHVGQLRSDVLRYEILHRHGGVYVDADLECLKPLDSLLPDVGCFAGWEVQDRWVGNTILGCTPGHPFMRALIANLPGNVQARAGCRPNKLTGPQYLTRIHRRTPGLAVFPQAFFYPYAWDEIRDHAPGDEFPDAFTAHHWHNQRREQGVPVASA